MQKFFFLIGIAVAVFLSACAHSHPQQVSCVGMISKIEELPGEHYSPAQGHQPLTRVTVRVHRIGNERSSDLINILFLGLYRPAQLGREGDTVRFICPTGPLQSSEAWFEDLKGYKIE